MSIGMTIRILRAIYRKRIGIKVRDEDGHVYLIPQFGIIQGKDMATYHWDEAFWIQKDVLIWDNFPTIRTMDQYFDLIARI